MGELPAAFHRTILAVDIEGFSARDRTNPLQATLRAGLYRVLEQAFSRSGLHWDRCYHEDRGDGVLFLIPPELPKTLAVSRLPGELSTALREHNQAHGGRAKIRVRVAVHAGEIVQDSHGVVGSAINLTFRLLEAPALKAALASSTGVIAQIVSEWFYEEVVRHHPESAPTTHRRVEVKVKETETTAWISLPDRPYAPAAGSAVPRAAQRVPMQLPAAVQGFVGREPELKELGELIDGQDLKHSTVIVSAISGTAGIGKTALAAYWSQANAHRFPDGQLYVNLRGYDLEPPLSPEQALDGFLRALDVPSSKIPADLAGLATLYRSELNGRRLLILLDNANAADQVRPLLPGSSGCLVLVTSRNRLSGLVARDGAHRITLESLSGEDSIALLRHIVGAERIDAEPEAAADIAEKCAYLPLTLRIVAERVAASAYLTLTDLAGDLAEEHDRLNVLATEDDDQTTAARAVFSWSYQVLPPDVARLFRLLGLHRGPDISTAAAAVLLGVSEHRARRLLHALTNVHLLEETARDRYRFHDLLRVYAAECAAEPGFRDDGTAAMRRLLTWYLVTADAADRMLAPHRRRVPVDSHEATFESSDDALLWCEAERLNLVAAVGQAGEYGMDALGWQLPAVLGEFLYLRRYLADWLTTHEIGLTCARRLGERVGIGWMLTNLGILAVELRQFDRAVDQLEGARAVLTPLVAEGGHDGTPTHVLGVALTCLGLAFAGLRRLDQAIDRHQQALAVHGAIANRWGEAWSLSGMGAANAELGQFEEAIMYQRQALAIHQEVGNRWREGSALTYIGVAYAGLGRFEEAIDWQRQALAIHREVGNQWGQAWSLRDLGEALHAAGQADSAYVAWHQALALFDELDPAQAAELRARVKSTRPGGD
ncbi:tetratricopeptide repeat protein [Amycolatopsis sp. cg5]|uniref:tetratricopeptide repeat protein n=1 Tax=Amycolatopsis sp. cg5 TaxID=3238802 RepID=UPI003524B85C